MTNLPHPIPYQGSKRLLAGTILGVLGSRRVSCLYEPFAGSAAITLAAANRAVADRFVIGDTLAPLVEIWRSILKDPGRLAASYARIWKKQLEADAGYYMRVREEFNRSNDPAKLLYLLARCVKNSPRWNREGKFNQSEDKRRLGMQPEKMAKAIQGAYCLLRGKAEAITGDFETTLASAGSGDVVYMDPPWEGTSGGRDPRYHSGLERDRLINALRDLNRRRVPWLLSYDGRCGEKTYGDPLPVDELQAKRIELEAGRSSQATLNGVVAMTVESLYVSVSLTRGESRRG
jgi:DNA adenine methylase